ncbi:hypothetical protein PCASD_20186 [Puccinia coronata f. sp. avenae]|uniref:Uncharacterized protein n=1 Tax=Puccinia coronata f. sp. avenae TaxID=200324 RepID=A0A2N5TMC3_9BASI|nr:hypothetical protein PCASD_20186 [Puccinia coronata f. sp. avenae]
MVMNLKKTNGIGKSHDNTDENRCMRFGQVANSRPPAKKACSFFDLLGLVLQAYQALPCPHRLKSLFPYHPWNCAGPSLKSGDPKETNRCRRMVQTKALTTSCQQLREELLHPLMALHQWKPTNCLRGSPVAIPAPGLHPKHEEPGAEPAENNQPRPPTPPVALPNPTSNPHDEPLEEAFEAFLKECNIANRDLYTRVILDHREIRHWSHFLLSSERNLCFIGLKDGPARSLCQGAKARQAAQNVTSFE